MGEKNNSKNILMLAAENDMLPGAKVGGVGDVIRDLPAALVKEGCELGVVLPSYGFLARIPGLTLLSQFQLHFAGVDQQMELYDVPGEFSGVRNFILHSENFSPQGDLVYCDDPEWRPFSTDATKFALFSLAVAEALKKGLLPEPDVLHLHDWHTAFLLILREYSQSFQFLKKIHCVYTIHNLAIQGVRPFKGDESALESWYPDLAYDGKLLADPVYPQCLNPMRAAILLADRLNTVSPSYAEEIQTSSNKSLGIYGGEGLEADLRERASKGELLGILNGCEYPAKISRKKPARSLLADAARKALLTWAAKDRQLHSAHWIASARIADLKKSRKSRFILSSVGRLTAQKARLFQTRLASGKFVLEAMLHSLGSEGLFILLGSGDAHLEDFVTSLMGKYENFIFLNGYSDELSSMLYSYGDLFVMPSSFEPCGISQMLAMRAGQVCLVNAVGGLKDTVIDGETGYVFRGESADAQSEALLVRLQEAMTIWRSDPEAWGGIRYRASQQRFSWKTAAKKYLSQLYQPSGGNST